MKKVFCAISFSLAVGLAGAIEVNRNELESAGGSVSFENYSGPHAVIESARAIMEIGGALGRQVAQNVDVAATFGEGAKYTLIHAVSDEEAGKLDADILVLNKNAGVDHITNLRRIVTGFLVSAYGYSAEDAQTISTFITVYNAVYRGNIQQFRDKYKSNVISLLDEKKVGLSTDWSQWAGNTQIVIPLGDLSSESVVDTSVISDENVVNALRENEDKGIEEREKLAKIKDREGENAQQKANNAQREAAEKKPDAQKAKEEAKKDPENQEKQKAAEKAQKKVADAKKESAEQQKIADKKKEEAKTDREEIKKDSRVVSGEVDLSNENYVNGLIRLDEKSNLYGLVKVNSANGAIVRTSPVKNIRGRTLFTVKNISIKTEESEEKFSSMYLTICGVSDGRSAVKLCLIDSLTLEMKKESEETLADDSALIQTGEDFFAVVNLNGEYYIGNYDQNLKLKKRSSIAVKPSTPISVTNRGILVTDKSGAPVILQTTDLSSIWGEKSSDAK